MADNINTDIAALQEIKKSLTDFREQVIPLKQRLLEYFDNQDYQVKREYERRAAEIEEKHSKGSDDGRTDSFVCDTCSGRIMLKILGDTTKCRESGCNGTLHRVYLDSTYSSEQRQRDIQELGEMKETIERYSKSKDEFVNVLDNFFTSEVDGLDSAGVNLTKCISILEEYLELNISMENSPSNADGTELKKKLKPTISDFKLGLTNIEKRIAKYKNTLLKKGIPQGLFLNAILKRQQILEEAVPSQQKWTQKSFKKRNESQYFVNLLKPTAFIPRFA